MTAQIRGGAQLSPVVIQENIAQGDKFNSLKTVKEQQDYANLVRMNASERMHRSQVAAMFGKNSKFDMFFVSRLPWKILILLSQKTKDLSLRTALAELLIYRAEETWAGKEQPSEFSLPATVSFITDVMGNLNRYRDSILTLHAYMRRERLQEGSITGPVLTEKELERLENPVPNLKEEVYGRPEEEVANTPEEEVAYLHNTISLAAEPVIPVEDEEAAALPEQQGFPAEDTTLKIPNYSMSTEFVDLAAASMREQISAMIGTFFQQAGLESPQSIRSKIEQLNDRVEELTAVTAAHDARRAASIVRIENLRSQVNDVMAAAAMTAAAAEDAMNSLVEFLEALRADEAGTETTDDEDQNEDL